MDDDRHHNEDVDTTQGPGAMERCQTKSEVLRTNTWRRYDGDLCRRLSVRTKN